MIETSSVEPEQTECVLARLLAVGYGLFSYLLFLVVFLYAIGFIGNLLVPNAIDSSPEASLAEAVSVNVLLLGLFALQHSIMARPGFKRCWNHLVPPAFERSTYVLASSLILALLFWQWRPIPGIVWEVGQSVLVMALWGLFAMGWLVVLVSTFLIDHFDLFGLRQVYLFAVGRPYVPPPFRTPALYRLVRHPIMLGFIIAFWAAPVMTWGHLLFAAMTTGYILIAIQLEERDLQAALGAPYEEYRRQASMIVPWLSRRSPSKHE